jgi:uncharacterized membrane protein
VELNSDGIHPCEYAKTTELSMSGEFYGMWIISVQYK